MTIYRVTGKLPESKTFAVRVEAANAVAAVAQGRKLLNDEGVADDSILHIAGAPLKANGSKVHIGTQRTRKPKAAAAAPAQSRKR